MTKEISKTAWSLWGVGLGLIGAVGSIIADGTSVAEALGMVLGGWIMAMLCYTAHFFLYAKRGLDPNQKSIWRIIKSILFVWLLIIALIFSLLFWAR